MNVPEFDADFTPDVFDNTYLNMEVVIPRDGYVPDFSKVMKHFRDKGGLPIDRSHNNPILDTRMYEVEYKDRHKSSLAANEIAENVFDEVNVEGNWHVLLQDVVDHRYDGTDATEQDVFITTRTRTKRLRETTNEVEVLVKWNDDSTTWVALKDMKNSYPVKMA